MHPSVIAWWSRRNSCAAECGAPLGWGGAHGPARHAGRHAGGHGADEGGGPFGVRRPLRFLTYKLELDEKQATKLARILDDLKTERAQAAVDDRRTLSSLADSLDKKDFDEVAAGAALQRRVQTAERLRDAVSKALKELHTMLDDEQRETLAYLIRTGALSI